MTKVRESSTQEEILELRRRLEEAEETLRAIREGEVDALVVDSPRGEMIYTLTSADYPYRLMIDEMNEGAVSVSPDSFILYSNRNFGSILGLNGSNASGVPFGAYIVPAMREQFLEDIERACQQSFRSEYTLSPGDGREVPVLLSFAKLQPQTNSISIVVTDLTAQKALEEKLRHAKNTLEDQVEERTKELRDSQARLFGILEHSAADLKAMRRLNEIGARCAKDGDDIDSCLKEILNVAIEITGADKGNVQLLNGDAESLRLVTQIGFDDPFLELFECGHNGDSACGVALHSKQRVVVEDIDQSEIYAGKPALQAMHEADVLAVESVPLVSSEGNALGIISTPVSYTHLTLP